jgi:hypothetical protein
VTAGSIAALVIEFEVVFKRRKKKFWGEKIKSE